MKTLARISVACALLCATAAFAMKAADGYALRWTPKEGDASSYELTGTFSAGGGEGQIKGKMTDKVTKIDPDGGYTVESSEEQTVTVNGADMPQPKATSTTHFKPNGSVSEIVADNVSGDTYRLANLNNFVAPDKPVQIGDTWQIDIPAAPNKGPHIKGSFKLDSEDKVGGVDAFKIVGKLKEAEGDTPGEIDSTVWLSKTDSMMLKGVSKWIDVTIPGVPVTISGDFTVVRVDPGK